MNRQDYERARSCPGDVLRGRGPVYSVRDRGWMPGTCERRPVSGAVVRFQLDSGGDIWGRLILPMCAAHALVSPDEFSAATFQLKPDSRDLGRIVARGLVPEFFMQPYGDPVQWMVVRPAA